MGSSSPRQRDPGQVERGQQVRVAEFGGETDPKHIEGPDRPVRVDGELRQIVLAHQFFQVRPDAVGALREHAFAPVEHFVKNLHALIRHAYLIGVRVHQRPSHVGAVPVLHDAVDLAADVLDRLAHQREERLKARVQRLDRHRHSLPTPDASRGVRNPDQRRRQGPG
jgi:hypothetical protein